MLQFKSTKKGQQLKSVDDEVFWLSPSRDIIYNFIPFCEKAFAFLENKNNPVVKSYYGSGGSNEEMAAFAKAMVAFIKETKLPQPNDKVKDAVARAGLMEFPPRAHSLFGYAYTMVTISHYYHSLTTSQNGEINTEAFMDLEVLNCCVKLSRLERFKKWLKSKFKKETKSSPTDSLTVSTEPPQPTSDLKT